MDHFFKGMWGKFGTGDGEFNLPCGIAVDSNNNIYVSDTANHRIQKFDINGDFIRKWGVFGTGDGQFNKPKGIATFSGNSLLVVDTYNNRIQEFSRDGNFITKFGSGGNQPGQFNRPIDVAINKLTGLHYILDPYNNRVQIYHWDPGIGVNPFSDLALPE